MSYRHVLWGYLIVALVSGGAVFGITSLDFKAKLSVAELSHQMALNAISTQAFVDSSEKLTRLKQAQQALHELDKTYTEKLTNEKELSQRLRDDLLTERRRVQFASADLATCELTINNATTAGSMGDATPIGLTRKGGLIVHDIRERIKEDRAKITYLQHYVSDVINQCKVTK